MKDFRALTGKLSWVAENTRPDIAFDVRELSSKNHTATLDDIRYANKVLKKVKLNESKVKFSKLGDWKSLRVLGYTDTSFRNTENTTKSVGGKILLLVNGKGDCNILGWKSKTIRQVFKSVKFAETRSLENGMEECILLK